MPVSYLSIKEVILEDKIRSITKLSRYAGISSRDSGVFDIDRPLPDEIDNEIAWAKFTLKRYFNCDN